MSKSNFFLKIIDFFKKLFKIDNNNLLNEANNSTEYINKKDVHQQNQYSKTNVVNSNNTTSGAKEVSMKSSNSNVFNYDGSSKLDNKRISEKNITMFLYKQVRLGNLDPKYIPDQYLEKVAILLKEEKKFKKSQIERINKEIKQAKTTINNLS